MRMQDGLSGLEKLKLKYADASVLVDPQVLTEKSFVVEDAIKDIIVEFDELERIMTKTSSYWKGAGGEHYRTKYKEKKEEIDGIFQRLKEHPEELRIMANNYTEVERKATEQNTRLRSDYV